MDSPGENVSSTGQAGAGWCQALSYWFQAPCPTQRSHQPSEARMAVLSMFLSVHSVLPSFLLQKTRDKPRSHLHSTNASQVPYLKLAPEPIPLIPRCKCQRVPSTMSRRPRGLGDHAHGVSDEGQGAGSSQVFLAATTTSLIPSTSLSFFSC